MATEQTPAEKRAFILDEMTSTENTYLENLHGLSSNKEALLNVIESGKFTGAEKKRMANMIDMAGRIESIHNGMAKEFENLREGMNSGDNEKARKALSKIDVITKESEVEHGKYLIENEKFSKLKNNPKYNKLNARRNGVEYDPSMDKIDAVNLTGDSRADNAKKEAVKFTASALTPVQRFPRYVLLAQDLAKRTEESHPLHQEINNFVEKFKVAANAVNNPPKKSIGSRLAGLFTKSEDKAAKVAEKSKAAAPARPQTSKASSSSTESVLIKSMAQKMATLDKGEVKTEPVRPPRSSSLPGEAKKGPVPPPRSSSLPAFERKKALESEAKKTPVAPKPDADIPGPRRPKSR